MQPSPVTVVPVVVGSITGIVSILSVLMIMIVLNLVGTENGNFDWGYGVSINEGIDTYDFTKLRIVLETLHHFRSIPSVGGGLLHL